MAPLRPEITLIIDEDNRRRCELRAMLEALGHPEIIETVSGTEAWFNIKNYVVDLILCDWNLGSDMNGLVLLKIVRADSTYASIPFFLVTDKATRSQVMEAGQAGVTDIIIRPFSEETLERKISQSTLLEDDPNNRESRRYIDQGIRHMKNSLYDQALESFEKVLEIHESAEVYYNMGYIKAAQGRFEEAIMAFRRATLINQAFAQAFQKMGEAYARMGRTEEARGCLQRAAEIFMEKNMDAEAEKAYLRVLDINPKTPNIFNSLGIVYRRQGRFKDSAAMYRKALKVTPDDERILYNLARSYLNARMLEQAAEALHQALRKNPDFVEARNLLQAVEMGRGFS